VREPGAVSCVEELFAFAVEDGSAKHSAGDGGADLRVGGEPGHGKSPYASIVRFLGLIGSKFGEDFLGSGRMPLRRRKIEVGEVGGSGQEEQRQEQGWHLSLLPFQKKGG